jgi:ankyrin repeat protein
MLRKILATALVLSAVALPFAAAAVDAVPAVVSVAEQGDASALSALLAKGADPDARRGRDGQTALMQAARLGRYDMVRDLLVHGAHKDLVDGRGRTAFDFAVEAKHSDIIALLRDAS